MKVIAEIILLQASFDPVLEFKGKLGRVFKFCKQLSPLFPDLKEIEVKWIILKVNIVSLSNIRYEQFDQKISQDQKPLPNGGRGGEPV